LDFQHHVWIEIMLGKLYLAPLYKGRVHAILDIGTGTGIWAINFCMEYSPKYQHCTNVLLGDERPETVVYGVDISPIQPCYAPPNCIFQIDDLEEPWDER